MKVISKHIDGENYAIVIHKLAKTKFTSYKVQTEVLGHTHGPKGIIELPLNDYGLSDTPLPFSDDLNQLVLKAYNLGAELLWFKEKGYNNTPHKVFNVPKH